MAAMEPSLEPWQPYQDEGPVHSQAFEQASPQLPPFHGLAEPPERSPSAPYPQGPSAVDDALQLPAVEFTPDQLPPEHDPHSVSLHTDRADEPPPTVIPLPTSLAGDPAFDANQLSPKAYNQPHLEATHLPPQYPIPHPVIHQVSSPQTRLRHGKRRDSDLVLSRSSCSNHDRSQHKRHDSE